MYGNKYVRMKPQTRDGPPIFGQVTAAFSVHSAIVPTTFFRACLPVQVLQARLRLGSLILFVAEIENAQFTQPLYLHSIY